MENTYTCYTKKIEGTAYYFIKKFLAFPEYDAVPPVLEGYGMHADFDKACDIAAVNDPTIRQQLLQEIETGCRKAKVIDLNDMNFLNQKTAGL